MKPAPSKKSKEIQQSRLPSELPLTLIIIVYALVTVVTPNLKTLDSNGPKFLALGIVNLLTLAYFYLFRRDDNPLDELLHFLRHPAGFLYLLLMILSLVSFSKAINIPESLMVWSKYFTGFTAALVLFTIFKKGTVYFEQLTIILTILLLIDGITVYAGIGKFINRELESVALIKSVYSNKNILASAIFVKMSFALWLFVFGQSWKKILGMVGLFVGFSATLFMSTRAFYLGIVVLTLAYAILTLYRYLKRKDRKLMLQGFIYVVILSAAVLIYTATQNFLFPKEKTGGYSSTITERLSTIESGNHSIQLRFMAWKNSWILIRDNPLLGVGIGNWRIAELEYENPYVPRNNYMLKAHNDFIEITTETGILGGIFLTGIFAVLIIFFGIRYFQNPEGADIPLLFASAIGLISYGIDAFFNFPSDRPEIHVLFAMFVGVGITVAFPNAVPLPADKKWSRVSNLILAIVMLASVVLLGYNFSSLRYQRVANDEIAAGKLRTSADYFLNGFPPIPTLTSEGEPIAITKAWFLVNDKRYQEAIDLVRNDNASPFNANSSYVIAWAYYEMGMPDSTIHYLKKTVDMMPINYDMVARLSNLLDEKGRTGEALQAQLDYLDRVTDRAEAWGYASYLSEKLLDYDQALKLAQVGLSNIPGDSALRAREPYLQNKIRMLPLEKDYVKGKTLFEQREYAGAVRIFTEILTREDRVPEIWEYRAKSYFQLKDLRNCIQDLDRLIPMKPMDGALLNLRGTCYYFLKETDAACRDFLESAKLGDKEGSENYRKVCRK